VPPRPRAARTGGRGEPPRPHAGTPPALPSVTCWEEKEPRLLACGPGPRAGSSTHRAPCRPRQPGLPFFPQRRPRCPTPVLPRVLPPVVRPSPGQYLPSQTEKRPRQARKMRRIRRPWQPGPRIGRLSSASATQWRKGGSPDGDTNKVTICNRHRVFTADLTESANCSNTIRGCTSEGRITRPSRPLARRPFWESSSGQSGRSKRLDMKTQFTCRGRG